MLFKPVEVSQKRSSIFQLKYINKKKKEDKSSLTYSHSIPATGKISDLLVGIMPVSV